MLGGAPVIEVSAHTGAGIESVRSAVEALAQMPIERDVSGRFFLPLDRTFTMRGFGQVVTGTLRGGELSVGDAVEIVPGKKRATVRALQNHNRPVEAAKPGQRVAVNLRHVDRDEVKRGDVLVPPGSLAPTTRLNAELHLLGDAPGPVRNGTVFRLLTGTTEAMATLRLLDRRVIEPGETAMAQFNLDREIATRASEHYLIRNYSPVFTIGGGRILEINPERHRRFDPAVTARLETVATGKVELIVRQLLDQSGAHGIRLDELAEVLSLDRDAIRKGIGEHAVVGITEDRWVVREAYDRLLSGILLHIQAFHERNPFKNGIDLGSLTNEMSSTANPEVMRHAVARLVNDKKLCNDNEILRIAGYDPFMSIGERERKHAADVERAFLQSGIEWLSPQAVVGSDDAKRAAFRLLIETGRLVRLRTLDRTSEMIIHAEVVAMARQAIERSFPSPQSFALKDIRDLLGSTRKHIVPLMEHMDATGVTVRYGDMRRLRGS
jgi:selenocysteine-specific elongation factor